MGSAPEVPGSDGIVQFRTTRTLTVIVTLADCAYALDAVTTKPRTAAIVLARIIRGS